MPIPPRRSVSEPANEYSPRVPAAQSPEKKSSGIAAAMLGLVALILAGGAAVYYVSSQTEDGIIRPGVAATPDDKGIREANYLRIGWKTEAYEVLGKFIAGKSVEEKLPFINNPDKIREEMEMFYGGVEINDEDTPPASFYVIELTPADKKRGLFALGYEQPPQLALKDFFRPLASLEVQYGIEEPGLLLSTLARIDNFSMEPVRVQAFFKRTDSGLKLDWEVFAQTKYRKLRNFTQFPSIGNPETFRVIIIEDVPEMGQGVADSRTYRIMDSANTEDSVRVNVRLDSEIGKELSVINWRGTKQGSPIQRTATVELEWAGRESSPVLQIKRFICWEFLGLGGEEMPATAAAE